MGELIGKGSFGEVLSFLNKFNELKV